jgi:tRNA(His) guanylyltransferase
LNFVNAGKSDETTQEKLASLRGMKESGMNELLFTQFGVNYNQTPNEFRKGTLLVPSKDADRRVRQRTQMAGSGSGCTSSAETDGNAGDGMSAEKPQLQAMVVVQEAVVELHMDLSKCEALPIDS